MARAHAFDANWLSAQAEAAEASHAARRPDPRATSSTTGSPRTPAAPRRRAEPSCSYGAVDRHLGGLAALLGRRDDAIRHLRTAIDRDAELGCTVWRLHGQRGLHELAPDAALAAEAAAAARARPPRTSRQPASREADPVTPEVIDPVHGGWHRRWHAQDLPISLLDPQPLVGAAVLLAGAFMVVLDFFIVNVALPAIATDLGAGESSLEWVVAGYGLAFAAFLITAGRLGDLFGRRRVYVAGLALFTLTSLACGLAPSPTRW